MASKSGKFSTGHLVKTLAKEAVRGVAKSIGASSGMAARTGRTLKGRGKSIDQSVSGALGRMREGQSTDSNN